MRTTTMSEAAEQRVQRFRAEQRLESDLARERREMARERARDLYAAPSSFRADYLILGGKRYELK